MGCGGSKEDVATGNTTANGNRLFRRKSTVSASHLSPRASSSSCVAVKDVVKETAAGEAKADVGVTLAEKPVAVVVEEKEEVVVVVKKDVTEDAAATAAATLVTEETLAPAAERQPKKEEEVVLPKSTMADEAVEEEEAKDDEANEVVLKEEETNADEEEKETSPAPTNEDGESVGRSTIEPVEAKLVDEHKVDEAVAVSEPSGKKNADAQANRR